MDERRHSREAQERDGRGQEAEDPFLSRTVLESICRAGAQTGVLLAPDGSVRICPAGSGQAGELAVPRINAVFEELFRTPLLKAPLARAWAGECVRMPAEWYAWDGADAPASSSETGPRGRFLRITLLPLPGPQGAVAQVLAVVGDETAERRKAEEDRRKDRRAALALFSGAFYRECNGYLGAILAQASALRLSAAPGQLVPPAVGAILDASQRAAAFLRRALEIGQETSTGSEPLSLNRCAREAARVLKGLLQERVRLHLLLGDGVPSIWGDADLLIQALVALGRQAEACLPAGGNLTLQTYTVDPPSPAAKPAAGLLISDTGLGMDAMSRAQALESLFPGIAGPGDRLDVAFARAVILQHRGHCELESAPGRGTQWRIVFPGEETRPRLTGSKVAAGPHPDPGLTERQIAHAAASSAAHISSAFRTAAYESGLRATVPPRGQPLILLADDEENFRDFGRQVLQQAGYEVRVAADGGEALERLQEDPGRYVLVILDAYMPRLGGLETFLRMQAVKSDLPVLFVSGFVRGSSREALAAACPGRAEVLLKPFTGEQLTQAVERTLKGQRAKSG